MGGFSRTTEERAAIGQGLAAVGGFTRLIGEERAAIESELAASNGRVHQADKRENSHWVRTGSSNGGGRMPVIHGLK